MKKSDKIYLAGHLGLVGSSILKELKLKHYEKIIYKTRKELNLTNQLEVKNFFREEKPDCVIIAAAKVGGIHANIIHEAFTSGVTKLLFLGSSCIYPQLANQPIIENDLLTGKLEPTNEPYAIAKIAGIKLCESYNRQYGGTHNISYRSIMPTNLYGPGDNYHPENSHVIPGLIRRFHEAKINKLNEVIIWGTGKPRREFLFVDDMASASIHVLELSKKVYEKNTSSLCSHINVGSGKDITIMELAKLVKKVVGYKGQIKLDTTKPDGTPKKLMNSTRLNNLGWQPKTSLEEGLSKTYNDFIKHYF